jgi:hypothetical protein
MTIDRIKELLEISEGVKYLDTFYDISTYDKSKSEVMIHVAGVDYIVSVDELAKDPDIAFYRWEKIE